MLHVEDKSHSLPCLHLFSHNFRKLSVSTFKPALRHEGHRRHHHLMLIALLPYTTEPTEILTTRNTYLRVRLSNSLIFHSRHCLKRLCTIRGSNKVFAQNVVECANWSVRWNQFRTAGCCGLGCALQIKLELLDRSSISTL